MEKEKLRIAICDDKKEDIERIAEALYGYLGGMEQPVECSCRKFLKGDLLYEANRKKAFHLVFLDIEMPEPDGFRLAEMLCLHRPESYLIFVSCHEELVFDAAEYMPLWFVRKERLEKDMRRALEKYFRTTTSLRVRYRMEDCYGYCELSIGDILYVECSGHKLIIQKTDGNRLEHYGSLKGMEEELRGYHFLRIHKNYLVNQRYISEVGKREVYLVDKSMLEMGRDRRVTVREAMLCYKREHKGL